jgi:hypothetical protein
MRYFDYDDNEDSQDDIDNFFNELEHHHYDEHEDRMLEDFMEAPQQTIEVHTVAPKDSKTEILKMAQKAAQKDWLWAFRSPSHKAQKVAELYTLYYVLLFNTEIEVGNEESKDKDKDKDKEDLNPEDKELE